MILNEAFLKTKIGTGVYKYSVLENKQFEVNKKYDLFISHSYMDKELVEVLYKIFEESGYEVYIDWKEENLQNRENVSADTARILKNRINFVELCRILWKSTKTCEEIWVVCKLKSNI